MCPMTSIQNMLPPQRNNRQPYSYHYMFVLHHCTNMFHGQCRTNVYSPGLTICLIQRYSLYYSYTHHHLHFAYIPLNKLRPMHHTTRHHNFQNRYMPMKMSNPLNWSCDNMYVF